MKCFDCGGELTSPQGITLKICPFCGFGMNTNNIGHKNRPEVKLYTHIQTHGQIIYKDKNRLINLIDELFSDDEGLVRTLKVAVNKNIGEKLYNLLSYNSNNQKRELYQISKFFADDNGYELYHAKEIIRVLALGLGIQENVFDNKVLNFIDNNDNLPTIINARGNTVGNIVNNGLVAKQGDWLYYIDNKDGSRSNKYKNKHKLYKIRVDGGGQTKLTDDFCRHINVIGEWVYYCHRNGNLYKIKTDGSNRVKLSDDNCSYLNVFPDWIYYCNESNEKKICKIRTDGSDKQTLNDEESFDINVVDGWIYYSNRNDGYKIYKICIDGTRRIKINNDDSSFLNVKNNWIYYINDENKSGRFCDEPSSKVFDEWLNNSSFKNGKLYKIRTDGTCRTNIGDIKCSFINVVDDLIYLIESPTSFGAFFGQLSKICIDGINSTVIYSKKGGSYINIADGWIYYYESDYDHSYNFMKIRLDGTEHQLVD